MIAGSARQVLALVAPAVCPREQLEQRAAELGASFSELPMLHAALLIPHTSADRAELIVICVFEGEFEAFASAWWRSGRAATALLELARAELADQRAWFTWLSGAVVRPSVFCAAHPTLALHEIQRDAGLDAWLQQTLDEPSAQQLRALPPLEIVNRLRRRWGETEQPWSVTAASGAGEFAVHRFELKPEAIGSQRLSRWLRALDRRAAHDDSVARSSAHFGVWLLHGDSLYFVAATEWSLEQLFHAARGRERWLLTLIALETRAFPFGVTALRPGPRVARGLAKWSAASRVAAVATYSAYAGLPVVRVERNRVQRELFTQTPDVLGAAALCASF
jgi:hypothetical protein